MEKSVEADFVAERANNPQNMSAEDLHDHLVLAKLMAQSYGMNTLNPEVWKRVKEMEKERKTRSAHLPERNRRNGPVVGVGGVANEVVAPAPVVNGNGVHANGDAPME